MAMKPVYLVLAATLLLGACPDSRVPKTPPRVPQPKIEAEAAKVESPAMATSPIPR